MNTTDHQKGSHVPDKGNIIIAIIILCSKFALHLLHGGLSSLLKSLGSKTCIKATWKISSKNLQKVKVVKLKVKAAHQSNLKNQFQEITENESCIVKTSCASRREFPESERFYVRASIRK